jgi:hypothetical protein
MPAFGLAAPNLEADFFAIPATLTMIGQLQCMHSCWRNLDSARRIPDGYLTARWHQHRGSRNCDFASHEHASELRSSR